MGVVVEPGLFITGEIKEGHLVFVCPAVADLTGNSIERCTATLAPKAVSGPEWAYAFFGRAFAQYLYCDYDATLADLERSIELEQNWLNWSLLAHTLATCPNKTFRDGNRAVEEALNAQKLRNDASLLKVLLTLAVAYAVAGDFKKANKYQKLAIDKANEKTKPMLSERLQLFENKPSHADFSF